jgi:GxxExxY protein
MTENEIANKIINSAIDVHRALGPGLLEKTYQECLFYKLSKDGLYIVKEKPMPLIFEGVSLECGYRIDLLVENKVVIEIKSVESLNDVHVAQTLTYLKLGGYRLGLLMNFNVSLMKYGIKRLINGIL